MNSYNPYLVAIIIIFLFYCGKKLLCKKPLMPEIYKFGSGKPIIVIMAGTHGNEPAPARYLSKFVRKNDHKKNTLDFIPYVNSSAIKENRRTTLCQKDVNRSWKDNNLGAINKYLLPIISKANLVIDMHEAWGFYSCSNKASLGQTLYTNTEKLDLLLHGIVGDMNKQFNFKDPCMKWVKREEKEHIHGSLNEWCTNHKIPYILVEMTGQNNIVPLKMRMKESEMLVRLFLHYFVLFKSISNKIKQN